MGRRPTAKQRHIAPPAGVDQAPMRRIQRRARDVGAGDVVTPRGQLFGEHTDRTTGFECVAVAPIRQQRQRDRVLALLVPPVSELPRVVRLGVDPVEVAGREPRGHQNTTSLTASSRRTTNGGSNGAVIGVGHLGLRAVALRCRHLQVEGMRGRSAQRAAGPTARRRRRVSPSATSRSGTPAAPHRSAARRPLPLDRPPRDRDVRRRATSRRSTVRPGVPQGFR